MHPRSVLESSIAAIAVPWLLFPDCYSEGLAVAVPYH